MSTTPEVLETIEETLTKLDPDIQGLAKRWARDCPDDWEDLAQEVRLGVYQKLQDNPACPRNHLFQVAKRQILDCRRKGSSVDSRLHRGFRRQFVYPLVSLDQPGPVQTDNSALYFKPHQLRPVEDLALTLVAYAELRSRLTEQQRQYLALRLQGYQRNEIALALGLSRQQGERVTREIKKEAGNILLAI